MRFLLEKNRSNFNMKYKAGLASNIYVPLNNGRSIGPDNQNNTFKTRPDTDSVKLTDWITNQIALGNIDVTPSLDDTVVTTTDTQTITGTKTFSDIATATLSGDITFSETVTSPATSATLAIKSTQVVHTIVGGATEVIPVNIPDGAIILGANLLVSVILAFTTGTAVTATWTNSTQQIGGTDALAAKNSKVTALYNANAESPIAGGTPETITLTADAGTVDTGEVVATVWYMELSDLTDVA